MKEERQSRQSNAPSKLSAPSETGIIEDTAGSFTASSVPRRVRLKPTANQLTAAELLKGDAGNLV